MGVMTGEETERQRYRQLFALAPDGYLVTDMQGKIREANQAAAAFLGVDPELASGAMIPPSRRWSNGTDKKHQSHISAMLDM